MAASKVAVFLDYQNVHLMAHGLFMPYGTPVQDALAHPRRVAERLVARRRDDSELTSVRVFRGRPNPGRQPIPAAQTMPRPQPGSERTRESG